MEEVFQDLDAAILNFKTWSSLSCKPGCGTCCLKPNIEATVLEFLPFAHHLYLRGLALEWLNNLQAGETDTCQILRVGQSATGWCSEYAYRGLICRLFGFSARTNKYGKRELATCQTIKTGQPDVFRATGEMISAGATVPVGSHYYTRLASIDPGLARDFYPVNQAIRKAIEVVLHYYAYRE